MYVHQAKNLGKIFKFKPAHAKANYIGNKWSHRKLTYLREAARHSLHEKPIQEKLNSKEMYGHVKPEAYKYFVVEVMKDERKKLYEDTPMLRFETIMLMILDWLYLYGRVTEEQKRQSHEVHVEEDDA